MARRSKSAAVGAAIGLFVSGGVVGGAVVGGAAGYALGGSRQARERAAERRRIRPMSRSERDDNEMHRMISDPAYRKKKEHQMLCRWFLGAGLPFITLFPLGTWGLAKGSKGGVEFLSILALAFSVGCLIALIPPLLYVCQKVCKKEPDERQGVEVETQHTAINMPVDGPSQTIPVTQTAQPQAYSYEPSVGIPRF